VRISPFWNDQVWFQKFLLLNLVFIVVIIKHFVRNFILNDILTPEQNGFSAIGGRADAVSCAKSVHFGYAQLLHCDLVRSLIDKDLVKVIASSYMLYK